MRALRGWCFYVAFSVTLVPIALACVLLWPFAGAAWRYQRIVRPWLGLVMGMLKFFCGVTYEVRGAENIPLTSGRPVVVLSKHSSAWETLFLPYYIDHRMGFVYKESMHWIPFLGWALKSMNMIAINRSNGAGAYVSFLKKGLRFVKNGWWVTLFPEGTRVAWGARARYKTGGARFAVAAKALVLPVAHDAGRLWPRNSIGKTSGTIHVTFGPVIDAGAADFETVNRELEDWIEGEIARMSGPDAGAAPVRNQSV